MGIGLHASYEKIAYPSLSYAQSHPDRLATLAILMGVEPPPIHNARVLELGCASGGNLIPMAWGLPNSRFVGIDFSKRQISNGQAYVAELGLKNLELQCRDILEIAPDFGKFDYIIAHGVYSWVARPVQDKVLQICKENLAPNGIAYVSYNTYPGWHLMNIVRNAMLFHTRKLDDPLERSAQARAMIDFMKESIPLEGQGHRNFLHSYASILETEHKRASEKGDAFLLHDELEEINEPIYFYQFAERAAECGLQYLVEANLPSVMPGNLPPETNEAIAGMAGNIIEVEQYTDFITNRVLRQTLLCHDNVSIQRMISPQSLGDLHIASRARPASETPDIHSVSVEQFRIKDGATLSTDHPLTKAAMICLIESWPRALHFSELVQSAEAKLNQDTAEQRSPNDLAQDAYILAANLLQGYSYHTQLVELHTRAVPAAEIGARPTSAPFSRLQARDGEAVTNMWHERVHLNPLQRHLLPYLDGEHDREALMNQVMGLVARGILAFESEGAPISNAETLRRIMSAQLERELQKLAHSALLLS